MKSRRTKRTKALGTRHKGTRHKRSRHKGTRHIHKGGIGSTEKTIYPEDLPSVPLPKVPLTLPPGSMVKKTFDACMDARKKIQEVIDLIALRTQEIDNKQHQIKELRTLLADFKKREKELCDSYRTETKKLLKEDLGTGMIMSTLAPAVPSRTPRK
jgi:hypothetical protein